MQKLEDLKKKDPLEKIRKEFDSIRKTETHRVVKLQYESCCGCGCDDVTVIRTVPYDSKLKNGDKITKIEKGDKWD